MIYGDKIYNIGPTKAYVRATIDKGPLGLGYSVEVTIFVANTGAFIHRAMEATLGTAKANGEQWVDNWQETTKRVYPYNDGRSK